MSLVFLSTGRKDPQNERPFVAKSHDVAIIQLDSSIQIAIKALKFDIQGCLKRGHWNQKEYVNHQAHASIEKYVLRCNKEPK